MKLKKDDSWVVPDLSWVNKSPVFYIFEQVEHFTRECLWLKSVRAVIDRGDK